MYKDKDKQREAGRERARRYKERQKALLKGVTSEGVTEKALPVGFPDILESYQPHGTMHIEEAKPERTPGGHIRVSKPGDADYELEHADQPKRNCKYCGKLLEHSVLTCCYECATKTTGLSRTSSTKGARL